MTGAMCLAAATQVPGTVPSDVVRGETDRVRIGHPGGRIAVGVSTSGRSIKDVAVGRTAREIMGRELRYRYVGEFERLREGDRRAGDDLG